jgi:hypothetical protein
MELIQCFPWQVSRRPCYHSGTLNYVSELTKLGSPLCVKFASFHCTTLEMSPLFDLFHDWLVTRSDDTMWRFTIIRTLDEYVLIFVLGLWCFEDILSLNIKRCLILLIFMEIGGRVRTFGTPYRWIDQNFVDPSQKCFAEMTFDQCRSNTSWNSVFRCWSRSIHISCASKYNWWCISLGCSTQVSHLSSWWQIRKTESAYV